MLLEQRVQVGEVELNYAEGAANGPPILLLHALTDRWQSMAPLIEPLQNRWHLFVPDLRGHGKTSRAGGNYRAVDYTPDIVGLLRQRVPRPAVLAGYSLGALVALTVAAACPDHVRGLVLLDPPLFTRNLSIRATPNFEGWFHWVHETVTSSRSHAELIERCRTMLPGADEAAVTELAATVAMVAPETVAVVLEDQLLAGCDLAATLGRVRCPTLILRGEWAHGSAMRDEDAAFVQAALLEAVIITLPGAGHNAHEAQTARVLEILEPFLRTLRDANR